jgi:hypothetical protein
VLSVRKGEATGLALPRSVKPKCCQSPFTVRLAIARFNKSSDRESAPAFLPFSHGIAISAGQRILLNNIVIGALTTGQV